MLNYDQDLQEQLQRGRFRQRPIIDGVPDDDSLQVEDNAEAATSESGGREKDQGGKKKGRRLPDEKQEPKKTAKEKKQEKQSRAHQRRVAKLVRNSLLASFDKHKLV